MLCSHEKFEVIKYPNPDELLNKRLEFLSKYRNQARTGFVIKSLRIKEPFETLGSVANVTGCFNCIDYLVSHLPDDFVT